MKRKLHLFCLVLFTAFFSTTIKAQALKDSIPVMISPVTDNANSITAVKAAIKASPNTRYMGFCDNHNVFILYISRAAYGSANNFLASLKSSSGVTTLVLKEGKTDRILKACLFSDATEARTVKASYDK